MKMHLIHPDELERKVAYTMCGHMVRANMGRTGSRFSQKQITTSPHQATCKRCVKDAEHAQIIVDHWAKIA